MSLTGHLLYFPGIIWPDIQPGLSNCEYTRTGLSLEV